MLTIKQWAVLTAVFWAFLIAGLVLDVFWLRVVATAGFAVLTIERAVNWSHWTRSVR